MTRPWRPGSAIAQRLFVAIVVLVVTGCVLGPQADLSDAPSTGPSATPASPVPSATDGPAPTASLAPSPTPGYSPIVGTSTVTAGPGAWLTVALESSPDTFLPEDVAANAHGYVIVGTQSHFEDPFEIDDLFNGGIWHSPDGERWSLLPLTEDRHGSLLRSVAASVDRFVAIGFRGACVPHAECELPPDAGPAAWTSDDGLIWTFHANALTGDGIAAAVASDGATFLAVGATSSSLEGGAAAWFSSDGIAWQRVETPPVDELKAVAGGPNGYIALGSTIDDQYIHETFSIWQTADGREWSPAGTFPDQVCCSPEGLAVDGESAVAVGAGECDESLIGVGWVRNGSDGTWQRATHGGDLAGSNLSHVVPLADQGFLAAGTVGGDFEARRVFAWASADGGSWTRGTELSEPGSWIPSGMATGPGGSLVLAWRSAAESEPPSAETDLTVWLLPTGADAGRSDAGRSDAGAGPATTGCDRPRTGTGWRTVALEGNFEIYVPMTWSWVNRDGQRLRRGVDEAETIEVLLYGDPQDVARIEVRARNTPASAPGIYFPLAWLDDDAWADKMYQVEEGTLDRAEGTVGGLDVTAERLESGPWDFLFVGVPAS